MASAPFCNFSASGGITHIRSHRVEVGDFLSAVKAPLYFCEKIMASNLLTVNPRSHGHAAMGRFYASVLSLFMLRETFFAPAAQNFYAYSPAVSPPSILMSAPVKYLASSLAKNA